MEKIARLVHQASWVLANQDSRPSPNAVKLAPMAVPVSIPKEPQSPNGE
jgi:hypothetical protein